MKKLLVITSLTLAFLASGALPGLSSPQASSLSGFSVVEQTTR